MQLLTDAHQQLDAAEAASVSAAVDRTAAGPGRVAGLDRLYGVVPVGAATLFTFKPAEGADPIDLRRSSAGPDGAPYVLDRSTKTVYRIDLKNKKATVVARAGQKPATGGHRATPKFLAVGGLDLLILDSKNVLWRWRPSTTTRQGHADQGHRPGRRLVGRRRDGHRHVPAGRSRGLYNLYVVDPSEQQIQAYSAGRGRRRLPGSSRPAGSRRRATSRGSPRPTSTATSTRPRTGRLDPVHARQGRRLEAKAPRTTMLRPAPDYSLVVRRALPIGPAPNGEIYVYDRPNVRIVAIDKSNGDYKAQYRLAGGAPTGRTCAACTSSPGADGEPATLVWMSADGLHQAILVGRARRRSRRPPERAPSPSPSASPAQGDTQADQEALPGRTTVIPLRDANPTRRTPLRHAGHHRRLLRRLRLRARPAGERRRGRARAVRDPRGASSRPS